MPFSGVKETILSVDDVNLSPETQKPTKNAMTSWSQNTRNEVNTCIRKPFKLSFSTIKIPSILSHYECQ